jgi:hypothetical protein
MAWAGEAATIAVFPGLKQGNAGTAFLLIYHGDK